ncbi:MAG: heavy metal translocating P-type ATPase [Proteobacteria bacterium]|nr:MAG: heavy metal translocating P-type ATPase [Pseudomonadota bacterium]
MTVTIFQVAGLCCPAEEKLIRNGLKSIVEIESLEFNFINQEVTITHTLSDTNMIINAISKIGMVAVLKQGTQTQKSNGERINILQWVYVGIGGLLAVGAETYSYLYKNENSIIVMLLAFLAMVITGKDTFKKGILALKSFTLNINFLMMLAIIGAVIIGEWPEAATVTVLFALAELIEKYSLDKARNAITELMEIAPEEALVYVNKQWQTIPVSKVVIDDIIKVRPGDKIPVDGIVISGESAINQASITGEAVPVMKTVNDIVYAGTINGNGSFEFKVTANSENTLLAKIIHAVESAQSKKAPTQKFVDKFALYYTPFMVLVAIVVALIPPLFFHASFSVWFTKALVLLVIACPCALVISTPVTVVSGLASAARHGLLIKGGAYLEEGHKLRVISLDKTGTITQGKPTITDIVPFVEISDAELIQLAASLDVNSEHPIAQAIVQFHESEYNTRLLDVEQFSAIPGLGAKGLIGSIQYYIGNHRLAEQNNVCNSQIEQELNRLENTGKTVVMISTATNVLGIIAVSDSIRDTSFDAINALHNLGIKTVMLTGDNILTAKTIAQQLNVDEVHANLLPEDKLSMIDKLITKYGYVGMVGDGINDAPALAKSTIGFAMGSGGANIALETADVALVENNLTKIPQFILLSRKTFNTLIQNIALAIIIKLIFFILALCGSASLWMAVVADMGASMLVIFNGLRLLKMKLI